MANEPISALESGVSVADSNLLPAVQTVGIGPVKITAQQLKSYVLTNPQLTTPDIGVATGDTLALGNSPIDSYTLSVAGTSYFSNTLTVQRNGGDAIASNGGNISLKADNTYYSVTGSGGTTRFSGINGTVQYIGSIEAAGITSCVWVTNGVTVFNTYPSGMLSCAKSLGRLAPAQKSVNGTIGDSENWIINNKSGSSLTLTMPTSTSVITGREVMIQNAQPQSVVSASANIYQQGTTGTNSTAILPGIVGSWATLVNMGGTNWQISQMSVPGVVPVSINAATYDVAAASTFLPFAAEHVFLNTYSGGGSCTVTLPDVARYRGKKITFVARQSTSTTVSNASNVVDLAGGAAGTAILTNTAGKFATMVSDGTSWQIIAAN